jgi:hypothetical protein
MSPTINEKVLDDRFATFRVRKDHLTNFSSSRSSRPKLATTLMAVNVSSAMPPRFLTTVTFCKAVFYTMRPNTPRIVSKNGRYSTQIEA